MQALARTSDALLARALEDLGPAILSFDLYGLLGAVAEAASALIAVTPYLFAADHLARQAAQIASVWSGWTAFDPPARPERLAVFADPLGSLDGVPGPGEPPGGLGTRAVWFPRCAREGEAPDPDALPAVARFEVPVAEPFALALPSLVDTVDRLWSKRITRVELTTPGPMGLVGLAAARLLRLPVDAIWHVDVAALVESLTGDAQVAALARGYVAWFYRSVDRVRVASEADRAKLGALGIAPDRIVLPGQAAPPDDSAAAREARERPERAARAAERSAAATVEGPAGAPADGP